VDKSFTTQNRRVIWGTLCQPGRVKVDGMVLSDIGRV